ncbi:hypothetical protein CMUS01_13243 [Colletotrichum musicola]|uniref:N-acetyltransferase domain-containing protein n=1 Tax=Colletotrichum musicola TaxID=2175873 RepID=A0A8H6JFB9_9PEZI|nr:hypothetical protein CMUS01_13243 [Colletotrichum musicola]
MSKIQVKLFPFDADSPEHFTRMVDQRTECGWSFDLVPAWQKYQRSGLKCIYWIALDSTNPSVDALVSKHIAHFPKEKEPLHDTATSIRAVARTPPGTSFHPVGHISLDTDNPPTRRLHLPIPEETVYWIKSLFVSYALQGAGIGRAAMDEVEASAARAPLCARVLMLDTVAKEDQHREELLTQLPGKPPAMSTQEWYARRGYRLIHKELDFYPDLDKDGKPLGRSTVFMRKDLD